MDRVVKSVRFLNAKDVDDLNAKIEFYQNNDFVVDECYESEDGFFVKVAKYENVFEQKDVEELTKSFEGICEWMSQSEKESKEIVKSFRSRLAKLEKEVTELKRGVK